MEDNKTEVKQEVQATQQTPNEGEAQANPFDKAEAILRKIEEANKRGEDILKKQEDIIARALISGKSFAGQAPEKPKEETPKEYAARILKGQK